MKKQERLNEIINLVNKAGTVYVQDIMESMQVSDMTVRRDLIELEKQGLIEVEAPMVRLTEFGIDVSNVVLSEFLLDRN